MRYLALYEIHEMYMRHLAFENELLLFRKDFEQFTFWICEMFTSRMIYSFKTVGQLRYHINDADTARKSSLLKTLTCNVIKKRPQHRCFPVNIGKFLKTAFL